MTGSARGIGRGIATQYARDGFDVAINYRRSTDAAESAIDDIHADTDRDAVAVWANVGGPSHAAALVEATADRFGPLAHVVNNAGINEHRYPEPRGLRRGDGLDEAAAYLLGAGYVIGETVQVNAASSCADSLVVVRKGLVVADAVHLPHVRPRERLAEDHPLRPLELRE